MFQSNVEVKEPIQDDLASTNLDCPSGATTNEEKIQFCDALSCFITERQRDRYVFLL